jgi:hypothetical protein
MFKHEPDGIETGRQAPSSQDIAVSSHERLSSKAIAVGVREEEWAIAAFSSPPPKGGGEVARRSRDGEGDNGAGYGSEGEAAPVLTATRTWTLYSAPVLFPHHCPPSPSRLRRDTSPQHSLGARTEPHSPLKSLTTLSGPNPLYSSGVPRRFTHTVWNPKIDAPAMSQRLDD